MTKGRALSGIMGPAGFNEAVNVSRHVISQGRPLTTGGKCDCFEIISTVIWNLVLHHLQEDHSIYRTSC